MSEPLKYCSAALLRTNNCVSVVQHRFPHRQPDISCYCLYNQIRQWEASRNRWLVFRIRLQTIGFTTWAKFYSILFPILVSHLFSHRCKAHLTSSPDYSPVRPGRPTHLHFRLPTPRGLGSRVPAGGCVWAWYCVLRLRKQGNTIGSTSDADDSIWAIDALRLRLQ